MIETAANLFELDSYHLLLNATPGNFACCQLQTAAGRNGLKILNFNAQNCIKKLWILDTRVHRVSIRGMRQSPLLPHFEFLKWKAVVIKVMIILL